MDRDRPYPFHNIVFNQTYASVTENKRLLSEIAATKLKSFSMYLSFVCGRVVKNDTWRPEIAGQNTISYVFVIGFK